MNKIKYDKNLEHTFCCTVEVYTIADGTSKNRCIKERQCISCCELHETPVDSIVMIKNGDYNKR